MVKVAILVPYRSDNGRRDELWAFTQDWLEEYHRGWPVYVGESPAGAFNRGAAINDAARKAGDWDVAIIHDADNIVDPENLDLAVGAALKVNTACVFPYDTYVYLDKPSTYRVMYTDNWFICPEQRSQGSYPWMIIKNHRSGIQVMHRDTYEAIGGYVEFEGWGYEDSATEVLIRTFVGPVKHMEGAAYHLYHDSLTAAADNKAKWANVNRKLLGDIMSLEMLPDQLREYLRAGGHPIP